MTGDVAAVCSVGVGQDRGGLGLRLTGQVVERVLQHGRHRVVERAPAGPPTAGSSETAGTRAPHNGWVTEPEILIRAVHDSDRPTLTWLVTQLWGSATVAVHGAMFRPAELGGFIAERAGRIIGLLTYDLTADTLEIVTLNAIERGAGIGTRLIETAVGKARRSGCREIRLTTTNDNVDALRFYQRRGFRLAELRPGAVDWSRREKPEIPLAGEYGIPLHDEIDLALPVQPRS